MTYESSPFHKFMGWKIWALLGVTLIYSIWFTTVGPYGALSGLAVGMPLEGQVYYSGAAAVEVLSQLDENGRAIKLLSLVCDIPFMILWALVFEAMIGFGIRRMSLNKPQWSLLFVLPIAFLLTDFAEDSFLALTLVTQSEILGSIAGVMTFTKLLAFTAAALTGLCLGTLGLASWLIKGRR